MNEQVGLDDQDLPVKSAKRREKGKVGKRVWRGTSARLPMYFRIQRLHII